MSQALKKSKPTIRTEYLSPAGVAQVLDVSERTVHALIHDPADPIPSHRIGRKIVRVRLSDLHEWMSRRRSDESRLGRIVDEVLGDIGRGRKGRQESGS